MEYIALICARAGSEGLPGKNIKLFDGKPLIGWSIEMAKKIEKVTRIIVSTDSKEIAKIALEFGAEVPFIRPKSLSKNTSPEWLVWRHAINYLEKNSKNKVENLLVLPVTAPLRSLNDVNSCITLFEKSDVDTIITVSDSGRSPYFNMVVNDMNNFTSLVIPPKKSITRRQDSPKVFDMTTVAYVVKASFVKTNNGIFDGKVKSVVIPKERAVDIDDLIDFRIAELFLQINNKGE